jgi:hypothetical protein
VIDPNVSGAFARLDARRRDALGAFESGFEPEIADVAGRAGIQPSANPLSVVAPEGTFFVATNGASGVSFSRNGTFEIANGELRFSGGGPVLGFALGKPGAVVPLRVDPYDAALGHATDPRVEADGTFAYARSTIDPRTGERRTERVAIGRVALARFPAGTQPERVDATHVRAPAGVSAHFGMPTDGRFAALATHARDLGRVDVIAGLERLREAYDDLDAVRAAGKAHGTLDRTTMDLLK